MFIYVANHLELSWTLQAKQAHQPCSTLHLKKIMSFGHHTDVPSCHTTVHYPPVSPSLASKNAPRILSASMCPSQSKNQHVLDV